MFVLFSLCLLLFWAATQTFGRSGGLHEVVLDGYRTTVADHSWSYSLGRFDSREGWDTSFNTLNRASHVEVHYYWFPLCVDIERVTSDRGSLARGTVAPHGAAIYVILAMLIVGWPEIGATLRLRRWQWHCFLYRWRAAHLA